MKILTPICLAIVTGILAAEPSVPAGLVPNVVSPAVPNAAARAAVETEIVARLRPSLPPFSRVSPPIVLPNYQSVARVGSEERLPFTVSIFHGGAGVSGYVRLSDNAIFIFRPETNDYTRSTLDSRFAPVTGTRIEPVKPT